MSQYTPAELERLWMSQHTPGPWTVEEGVHGARILSDEELVAESVCRAADARLIAAAPELLSTLKVLVERIKHYAPQMNREGDVDDALAVIAKAEGR